LLKTSCRCRAAQRFSKGEDVAYWWSGAGDERYWCEITDRPDLGADLKCPQVNERGDEYWSYSLIRQVAPGDIVFHYSTVDRGFVGGSVAGGPLEDRAISWTPHGTAGRGNRHDAPRPGWWLPLHGFSRASDPLTLKNLRNPTDEAWIATWMERVRKQGTPAAPFQSYPTGLRAAQGYLTKMPREFVERWPELAEMASRLERLQERLDPLQSVQPAAAETIALGVFAPKSDAEYVALIRAGEQRRTRRHERLVREVGEYLASRGASVATSFHPIDLLMIAPAEVFEAKIVVTTPVLAVREAVGQLFEYSYFLGRSSAALCVLLDAEPGHALIEYAEKKLGLLVAWWTEGQLHGGDRAMNQLSSFLRPAAP
jgi:hypothetical protein